MTFCGCRYVGGASSKFSLTKAASSATASLASSPVALITTSSSWPTPSVSTESMLLASTSTPPGLPILTSQGHFFAALTSRAAGLAWRPTLEPTLVDCTAVVPDSGESQLSDDIRPTIHRIREEACLTVAFRKTNHVPKNALSNSRRENT